VIVFHLDAWSSCLITTSSTMYEHNNLGLISIVLLIPVVPAIVTWNARFCLPKPLQKRATKWSSSHFVLFFSPVSMIYIYIYIYIYCIYILHLGAFNIENAPRPNLCARSETTVPPRPVSSLPHAPDRIFSLSRPRPSFSVNGSSVNGSSANGSTSSHKLQSHQTCSCNYTRQQLQLHQAAVAIIVLFNRFLDIVI
jgi:hypothetical protein